MIKPRRQTYLTFSFILFGIIALSLLSCRSGRNYSAVYTPKEGSISIVMELVKSHPFLSENERYIILMENGKEIVRKKLFPDTGGYASSNLYQGGFNRYFLKGYFDSWILDLNTRTITEGDSELSKLQYLGIFDMNGSSSWNFYSSSQRNEVMLKAKGE